MDKSFLYPLLLLLWCGTIHSWQTEEFIFNDCQDKQNCFGLTSSACQYQEVVNDCPILCNSTCDITDWESNALGTPPCVPMKKLVNLHLPEVSGFSYSVTHVVLSRCRGLHDTMACVTDNTTTTHGSVTRISHEGKHRENIKVTFLDHHSCHYEKSKCKKKYLQEEEECYELEESHYWNEAICKCECYVQHALNDCVLDKILNHYQHTSAVYYVPMLAFSVGLIVAIVMMLLWQQNQSKIQEKYNALNHIRNVSLHCNKHHPETTTDAKDEGSNEPKKTGSRSDLENPTTPKDSGSRPGSRRGSLQGSPGSMAMRKMSDNDKSSPSRTGLRRTSGDASCPGGSHFASKPAAYLHTHSMHTQQLGPGYERVSYGWS